MDSIDAIGRYALSVVLSFLTEPEGTSLMLTRKRFSQTILPLFRLSPNQLLLVQSSSSTTATRRRYYFRVIPVQDPQVLLDRLNTRRLRKRTRYLRQQVNNRTTTTFECHKTTSELAESEWAQQIQDNRPPTWPAPCELLRFLRRNENTTTTTTIVLASYPRSGNTLLRTLLERTTGIVTGSDTRPDRPLSRSLSEQFHLVGEGVTDGRRCRIVKTHHPERRGYPTYQAERAILLVRNPFDAMDSYWNLNLTNTHTETVTEEVYARFYNKFEGLVKNEMKVWLRFHQYWLTKHSQIPLLIVRYEDLVDDTQCEMERIVEFVTCETHPLSEFWKGRIRHALQQNHGQNATINSNNNHNNNYSSTASMGAYQPRSACGGTRSIGKSLRKGRYSETLLRQLHVLAHEADHGCQQDDVTLLQWFGYDVYHCDFPTNFIEEGNRTPQRRMCSTRSVWHRSAPSITINEGPMVRDEEDPYGRPMRAWRRAHTKNDKEPFPTVPRDRN